MEKQKFFITTAIAYLNGSPHMGHALEIIQADCIARFHRLFGDNVVFQTGSDEHGTKIYNTAKKSNKDIVKFIEGYYNEFINLYKSLNISYDRYVRTTSSTHKRGASKLWLQLQQNGDIYKSNYAGIYCIGCEAYKTSTEIEDGICPYHPNRELVEIKEENYFFKLSKYVDQLLEIYNKDIIEIHPKRRKAEVISFLRSGVEDISFSRQKNKLPWGISVPDDKSHVMYVWADALSNYITNVGYEYDEKEFKSIWPADIHLIGKDIIRFHAIYWPAMLLSAGIELPKKLFVHGFLTLEGSKIGKSIGNVVDPLILIDKYGRDPFRFHLLKNISTYDDGSFREEDLVQTYNNTLADDLGNLILRVLTFIERDFNNSIPNLYDLQKDDTVFVNNFNFVDELKKYIGKFQLNRAIERIWEFVKLTNKFVNDRAPWLLKKNGKKEEYSTVLYVLVEAIRVIAIYVDPYIPSVSKKLFNLLDVRDIQLFKDVDFKEDRKGTIGKKEVFFPKLIIKKREEKKGEDKKMDYISYEDFTKLDIRVGLVESVEKVPKADKLLKLTVDIGPEKRTIVAGLAEHYEEKDLIGKKIIVLANLEPRKLRGVESQGMLLAADDGKTIAFLTPEKEIPPGSKIS